MTNNILQEDIKGIASARLPWDKLSGGTILISGASGFIASYFVRLLLYLNSTRKKNINVLALVRNKKRAEEKFFEYLGRKDFHLLVQDVNEPLKYSNKIDFIIHAASHASPKYYRIDPLDTALPNILGTINLLKLAQKNSVKSFLFFSSGEVYGLLKKPSVVISESEYGALDPTNVRSCYAESKRMGESLCISWFVQHNVPIKIVRPFHVYGPGMALDDGRVQADFVANVVSNEDIVMKSNGEQYRTFCYVTDATEAFFRVLLTGVNGEVYNVGNDEAEIQIKDLARVVATSIPKRHVGVIRQKRKKSDTYMPSPIIRCIPKTEKIRALGWVPNYPISIGFKRTIESYL